MLSILFWVFWFLGLVYIGWRGRSDYLVLGGLGIGWLLFFFLGLAVFGNPLSK